jgi:hypothetical protein
MLPPFTESPDLHGSAFGICTGFGLAVVGSGVNTYVHVQATVSVVDPFTVAVKVCTCPAITLIALGVTETVTTFALELPHPDITIAAPAAHPAKIAFLVIRQLMDEISLVNSPRKFPAGLPKLSRLLKLISPPFL